MRTNKLAVVLTGWQAIPRTRNELLESVRLLTTLRAAGWHLGLQDEVRFSPLTAQPMLTYGAIGFLESYIQADSRVLEFGSGGSTIWLASRAGQVISIEDSEGWSHRIPRLGNVELRVIPCTGDWYHDGVEHLYSTAAANDGGFDVIVIDGKARIDCAREALSLVNPGGLIVLDDLHDTLIEPAIKILKSSGLKTFEFWGIRPGSGEFGGTAIFIND